MIIEKIKIGGFGKFKNFELNLLNGFQIIYGKNESGKSTIMDFIMLMFYSRLSGEKAGKRDKETRQKYLPWNGGKMSGTIEFIHDSDRYLLTKEFHVDTPNKDKIILKNVSVGENIPLGQKEEVGEWLFDLDLKGYERSGLIRNIGLDVFNSTSNKKDSLSDKIFKIVTGQEQENISEGLIIKKLDISIKDLEKNKGRIDIIENEICNIKNKIFKLNQQIEIQDNYKKQLEILGSKLKDKKNLKEKLEYCILLEKLNNLKELKSHLSNIEDIKKSIVNEKISYKDFLLSFNRIENLKSQINYKEKVLNEFESLEDNVCIVSEDDFNVFEETLLKRQEFKNAIFSINNSGIEKLYTNEELVNKSKLQIKNKVENINLLNKKFFISKSALAIGTLAEIFIGLALKNIFLIFLLGGLSFILFFGIYKKFNSALLIYNKEISNLESSIEKLSCENQKIRKSLNEILLDANIICDKDQYENILVVLNDKILKLESTVNDILNKYNCKNEKNFEILYIKSKNRSLSLEKCQKIKYEIKNLKDEFLSCLHTISKEKVIPDNYNIGYEKYSCIYDKTKELENLENIVSNKSRFINKQNISIEEINSSIVSMSENLKKYKYNDFYIDKNKIEEDLKNIKNEKLEEKYYEVKSKIDFIDLNVEDLESLLKNKCNQLLNMKNYLKSLKITRQVFEEAVKEIRRDVVPLLDLKASEIFSKLTNSKYDSIHIQKDYTIFVGDNINYTSLSSGTIDQAYLSLRIAMSEIISKGSHIPFFMDDILMQYDSYRLSTTLKFLKDFFEHKEKDSQAVIFTCHDNLLNFAKDYNCNIVCI